MVNPYCWAMVWIAVHSVSSLSVLGSEPVAADEQRVPKGPTGTEYRGACRLGFATTDLIILAVPVLVEEGRVEDARRLECEFVKRFGITEIVPQ
jgi:hypothetical protein